MEQLWPGPPLDSQVKPAAAPRPLLTPLFMLLMAGAGAPRAWAHAADLILAKCWTDPAGQVTLTLSVDCARHPVLTDEASAWSVLREILRVETPAGPVPLFALTPGEASRGTDPDPEVPVTAEPLPAGAVSRYAMLRYAWQPEPGSLRFSVKPGSPYDVLFWLGSPRVPGQAAPARPVPWQMLMSGDVTPAIAVSPAVSRTDSPAVPPPAIPPPSGQSRALRAVLALAILTVLPLLVIRRQAPRVGLPDRR